MSKWPMVRLEDCIDSSGIFSDGDWVESKDQDPAGDIRLIQLADIGVGEFKDKSQRFMTAEKFEKLKCTELLEGDILIARMPDPIGRVCIFTGDIKKCATVVDIAILRVDKGLVDNKWMMYKLNSPSILHQYKTMASGTTRQRVARSKIAKLQIALPPLEEQKRIAAMLDKAQALIDLRKKQIAEMDTLVKAKFIEMFGDVINNDRGWEVKPIKDFALVRIGPFGSLLHAEDYVENGIPLVNPSHIIDDEIITDPKLTLTTEKYTEMSAYALKSGDVVLGRRGEIGRCAVVNDGEYLCGTGSMFIRIEHSYLPMMLQRIISSDAMRRVLENKAVGVTMLNLNSGMIANLEVIVPPLAIQNRFADFVQEVNKSKLAQQEVLEQMGKLYNALIQQAFN